MTKKLFVKLAAFLLCIVMVLPVLAACDDEPEGERMYSYRSVLGTPTTDWNPHTSQTTDGNQLQGYMYTPFYGYAIDQEADAYGLATGQKEIYEAASGEPVDITAELIAAGKFTETGIYGEVNKGTSANPEMVDKALKAGDTGRAWRIPLRKGMKWDNGDPITSEDYVWSLEKLLNPDWNNFRHTSYDQGTSEILGAAPYFKGTLTDFSKVGYYGETDSQGNDYLVIIFANPKSALDVKINGCGASYLVHEDTYMANVTTIGDYYVTDYNKPSNWENTRSSGPYKMESFSDQAVSFVKNENWFGHTDRTYIDQYGLDEIYQINRLHFTFFSTSAPDVVNTMMLAGQLEVYGVNLDYKQNYTNSLDKWRYAPGGGHWWLDIITDLDKLEAIERNDTSNATLLAIPQFRLAMSMAIDRFEALSTTAAASKPMFTLMTVVNLIDWGWSLDEYYRETLPAKKVITDLYELKYQGDDAGSVYTDGSNGVYADLDEALALASGFDFDLAVELFNEAYQIATDTTHPAYNPRYYNAANDILINIYQIATQETIDGNSTSARLIRYIMEDLNAALKASDFAKDATGSNITIRPKGNAVPTELYNWFDDADIEALFGGVSGGTASIPNHLALFVDPDYTGWYNPYRLDSESIMITIGDETLSLLDWYKEMDRITSLAPGVKDKDDMDRLVEIGAACELALLQHASSIPIYESFSATVYSHRFDMSSMLEEYNSYVGFGSFAEYKLLYDDVEWAAYVANQPGGVLTY